MSTPAFAAPCGAQCLVTTHWSVVLRLRHREILREEIAQTVTSAKEVDEEIRHMREVLNR